MPHAPSIPHQSAEQSSPISTLVGEGVCVCRKAPETKQAVARIPAYVPGGTLTDEARELAIVYAGKAIERYMADWEALQKRKADRARLTQATVREYLLYVPETGLFFWKKAAGRRAKVGAIAGGVMGDGYVGIYLGRNRHLAHRLAWLYVHGEWPAGELDHINRERADNRIANLRLANRYENAQNAISYRSKHGVPGVNQRGRIWQAQITAHGKKISLGFFPTKEEASAAYIAAKHEMHPTYTHRDDPKGDADRARRLMELLIAGRSAEQIAKMTAAQAERMAQEPGATRA